MKVHPDSGRMDDAGQEPAPVWLVVYSKPGSEKKAERWLGTRGWVVYLPMMEEAKITRQGEVSRVVPLFPRYLFVREEADLDPVSVAYLPGVSDVVRRGDRSFARVENDVILALRATEQDGVLREAPPADAPPLAEGEAVQVDLTYGGIGYQIVATFSRMDGTQRAVVLHEMFGARRESTVTLDRLQRVKDDAGSS